MAIQKVGNEREINIDISWDSKHNKFFAASGYGTGTTSELSTDKLYYAIKRVIESALEHSNPSQKSIKVRYVMNFQYIGNSFIKYDDLDEDEKWNMASNAWDMVFYEI